MQKMKKLHEPWSSSPKMILQIDTEEVASVVQERELVRALFQALDLVVRLRLKLQSLLACNQSNSVRQYLPTILSSMRKRK